MQREHLETACQLVSTRWGLSGDQILRLLIEVERQTDEISRLVLGANHGLTQIGNQMISIHDPKPEQMQLPVIGRSLSKICRYSGNTVSFYSVAEHSVYVYRHLRDSGEPIEVQRAGLMHDAPEFLLGDIISPVKRAIGPAYGILEDRLWGVIATRFKLPMIMPEAVKVADRRILMNEKRDAMYSGIDWGWECEPLEKIEIKMVDSKEAFRMFRVACDECGIE